MHKEKVRVFVLGLIVIGFFSFAVFYSDLNLDLLSITGFVTYGDSGSSFNNGTFNNTLYNGSSIILSSNNLTGTYTSQVIDASADATWNNLTWTGGVPNVNFLFAVDGAGDVYSSPTSDLSTWSQKMDGYGRTSDTEEMASDSSYLYIISQSNKELWRSVDGTSWSVIHSTFADSSILLMEVDSTEKLFVVDASGDVYSSTNQGSTWTTLGDFNGGLTNNGKGMAIDSSDKLYIIDGAGDLFSSTDSGSSWSEITTDYAGSTAGLDDMEIDSDDDLYILDNKKIWKSTNDGVNWTTINSSFTTYSQDGEVLIIDSNNKFYIADASGRIWNSTNSGVTWFEQGDINAGASSTPKGLAILSSPTNISFQVKNCSTSNCADANFQTVDLNNINLNSRYFQYKTSFSKPNSTTTPFLTSVSINYDLLNNAPTITLTHPTNSIYGYNTSLPINFTTFDADSNIVSCWYDLDSTGQVNLPSCLNATFNTGDGAHNLTVYVNDSLGETASDNVNFTVQTGEPEISLVYPSNNSYLASLSINLTFTPSDFDLDACSLYTKFNNTYTLNQTDSSPTSSVNNSFSLTLADGVYEWGIICSDDQSNFGHSTNSTFTIDTTTPSLSITEPTGAKTSRTSIPITYTVSDETPITCSYYVNFSTGGSVISPTVLSSCSSSTFDVSTDGDYIFYLTVNDSAQNIKISNTNFSVSTGTTPTNPSGGGGSSGGGSSNFQSRGNSRLKIDPINLILLPNEERAIQVNVKNIALTSVNKCSLSANEGFENSLDSSEIKTISGGEIVEFPIVIRSNGKNLDELEVSISCLDHPSALVPLTVVVLIPEIKFDIKEVVFTSSQNLNIKYVATSSVDSEEEFVFKIKDQQDLEINSKSSTANLKGNEELSGEVDLDLSNAKTGLIKIQVYNKDSLLTEEPIIYSGRGITGFALFDVISSNPYVTGVIAVLLILIIWVGIRIFKLHKITRSGKPATKIKKK